MLTDADMNCPRCDLPVVTGEESVCLSVNDKLIADYHKVCWDMIAQELRDYSRKGVANGMTLQHRGSMTSAREIVEWIKAHSNIERCDPAIELPYDPVLLVDLNEWEVQLRKWGL